MNLLDFAQKRHNYKKVSGNHGGEYHGPCPVCGGTDRFHIWPLQGDNGTYWCRSCDQAGDCIQYLMQCEQMPFRDAAQAVGKELTGQEEYQAPRFVRPAGTGAGTDAFIPRATVAPADLWVEHATKLADWAHEQLLNSPAQLAWLAARGLDHAAVVKYRLGWNPGEKGKDLYRAREAWGLPPSLKEDGKAKKLWLPIGLIIPYWSSTGVLRRLRIRRPEGEPRYYLVPGSDTAPMVLPPHAARRTSPAYVIVESELDAILLHHVAVDLAGAISQGNSTAKPDAAATTALEASVAILVALDSDDAGMQAAVWWKKHFPQAERWPVPVGKDPGEAWQAGVDLRAWVKAGLPPVFHISTTPVTTHPVPVDQPLDPAERSTRAEQMATMYDEINLLMPAGALEWLRNQSPGILDKIQAQEQCLEVLCDGGSAPNFAHVLDLVRRMWLRAWQVYRESPRVITVPDQPARPSVQPGAPSPEQTALF